MKNQEELIETTLKDEEIAFEAIPEEHVSPLAQPVIEKISTEAEGNASDNAKAETTQAAQNQGPPVRPKEKPTDAPEQEIDAEAAEESKDGSAPKEEEFTIPLEHAGLMADSIIGTIDSTIFEVGGGYFVTISKHKDFYDFEEVIQIIEEQNVKNVKRLKLDEEDKALLRPLLIQILRKKAAALSVEKQLLMVALSILIKKGKVVMEMRAENEILVERIRDIIRKEVNASKEHQRSYQQTNDTSENNSREMEFEYEETIQDSGPVNRSGLPDEVLEVMD